MPSSVVFQKFHAYGNDFLITAEAPPDRQGLTKVTCRRHFGVGADGCIFLRPGSDADFEAEIINRDGSPTTLSGNGVRCAAAFLHSNRLCTGKHVVIRTGSGLNDCRLVAAESGVWTFRTSMAAPEWDVSRLPVRTEQRQGPMLNHSVRAEGRDVLVNVVWVGNPQCVVLVDELPDDPIFHQMGRALEIHDLFPERCNVSFARVVTRNRLRIRIWERGVGPTMASGTGAAGAAVVCMKLGHVERSVSVESAGGVQRISWDQDQIDLEGKAWKVADIRYYEAG